MESNTSRGEAERLLGISEKLLQSRDLNGSREFAVLAQETEPLLDGSDQILAVVDVLQASERRVNNQHHDWYAILQLESSPTADADLLKRHYRRLALLLHPDKNRFPFSDQAFRLVAQAWSVLSDPSKKSLFDADLASSSKPRSAAPSRTFWTVCPYCYVLFEYPTLYEDCCLKCQKCDKAFHAAAVEELPPVAPGNEGYYCCMSVFPLGFVVGNLETRGVRAGAPGFPNWMPPLFHGAKQGVNAAAVEPVAAVPVAAAAPATPAGTRKRGRPRLH